MSFRNPNPVSTSSTDSDPMSFVINSKIILTATIIILFIVLFMIFLHHYSRRSNLNRHVGDPSTTAVVTTHGGLNPSVIKSLPEFTFSATAQTAMECGVCLSELEDNETCRVLPNCSHTFHIDCIDMWFHSHSTCPLCRSLVEPFAGGVKSMAEEVSVSRRHIANPSTTAVVTTHGGLNPSVIKSLPEFTFSATAQTSMECGVCLSELEDNETYQVLPNCNHTFHIDCIDMWFHSHSTCPICRSLVEPFAGGVKSMAEKLSVSQ
ncbi:PREDICTED: RING-H2 finger protein ATL2-like [Camelina sativa]|uniref:RING-type E3 ubiquitin transferase n=1 Tax=Camelina sativa TaxID=90675 RepID=A0ABM0V2L7_CAMSA|nr:PREDICTED: RING-H2 finger protein ATL2-like [Camelina sativa]